MATFGTPEESRRFIDEQFEAAAKRNQMLQRAEGRLNQLVIQEWSPRREVMVSIDRSGLITDVVYADSAPTTSPMALARGIQHAHDQALRRLEDLATQIAEEELAADDTLRESMVGTYRQALRDHLGDTDED